jgi:hypothetical protein
VALRTVRVHGSHDSGRVALLAAVSLDLTCVFQSIAGTAGDDPRQDPLTRWLDIGTMKKLKQRAVSSIKRGIYRIMAAIRSREGER